MTDAVKPCPFCGGESATNTVRYSEAHVKEQGWKQYEFYGVNCIVCGADNRGLVGHSTKEKAIEAWNHRTPPAAWKPIETAPKDGTRILMWDAEFTEWKIVQWDIGEPSILCGDEKYWVTDSEGPNPDNHIVENPKYWMPLPAAPENET